jgi:serine/threonine protein kinase
MHIDHGAEPSPTVGRILGGRYRLEKILGRGGAADVHAATDLHLARTVAVKLFRSPADELAGARMESEALLLGGLSHPGLLAVYDFDVDRGQPFLVMQRVKGGTLRDRLNQGPLEPTEAAGLGHHLAATLDYLHRNDVTHRDVKPSNVLIDRSGTCYLADFGVARAAGTARLTGSGEFIGTAGYLAPEQITDSAADPAVDIYALGLVLLEALTGEPAYTGTEVETAIARLVRQPHIPERLPPAWRTLLIAMTSRDPAHRPSAARCAELLGALSSHPPTGTPTTSGTGERPSRRRLHQAAASVGAFLTAFALTTANQANSAQPAGPAPTTQSQQQSTHAIPTQPPAGRPSPTKAAPAPPTPADTTHTSAKPGKSPTARGHQRANTPNGPPQQRPARAPR